MSVPSFHASLMAPGLKFLSKRRSSDDSSRGSENGSIPDNVKYVGPDAIHHAQTKETSVEEYRAPLPKTLGLEDFIQIAFGNDAISNLVALANARDDLVKDAADGFYPDVITGSVDICMAIVLASLTFSESIDAMAKDDEIVMRERVKSYILSILDAVYGPNCVKIAVYNPEIDWSVSLWQMFPVSESPSSRNFLTQVPSQSDAAIQWMDVKSRLIKECRNPKRDAQRTHKITALEEELKELSLRHASLIERFIKIQQGEKDPEGAQLKRDAEAKRLVERKIRLCKLVDDKHRIIDPSIRSKRDAILWGGQPHMASAAALNASYMTKNSTHTIGRRLSRFGFRNSHDDDDLSSGSSSEPDPDLAGPVPTDSPKRRKKKGFLSIFRCCGGRPLPVKSSPHRRPS
jgi:hypothetical protein